MLKFGLIAAIVFLSSFAIPYLVSLVSGFPEFKRYGETCQYAFYFGVVALFLVYFGIFSGLTGFKISANAWHYAFQFAGFTLATIGVYKRC
jgi:hypothetical protein